MEAHTREEVKQIIIAELPELMKGAHLEKVGKTTTIDNWRQMFVDTSWRNCDNEPELIKFIQEIEAMKEIAQSVAENLEILERKIIESLAEIKRIQEDCSVVKNGQELHELESRIIQATDKLAGSLLGLKIQNSLINPDLKEEGSQLAKGFPKKTKNQGPRDIEIKPSRGEAFTVSTTYVTQKGKHRKKKSKRILS